VNIWPIGRVLWKGLLIQGKKRREKFNLIKNFAMQFDFISKMKNLADEELLRVLTVDKDNYIPEALVIAQNEFDKRNLPADRINFITKDLSKQKVEDDRKAKEPIDFGFKILTFLFSMIITFFCRGFTNQKGMTEKQCNLETGRSLDFVST
jgi:hypothetical protein